MQKRRSAQLLALVIILGVPLLMFQPVFAQAAGVNQVENFIRSIVKLLAGLSGLVATGFFVFGGFVYITSSGNPERLDKGKRTLTWAAVGLTIALAAFVLSNIVSDLATSAFGT